MAAFFKNGSSGFSSRDCVDVVVDGPGDTTVRPMSPERRAQVIAEQERLARLLEQVRMETGNPNLTWEYSESTVIVDGPGDTTVRPVSPERRAYLVAEKERIARLMEEYRREQEKYKSAGEGGTQNGPVSS